MVREELIAKGYLILIIIGINMQELMMWNLLRMFGLLISGLKLQLI